MKHLFSLIGVGIVTLTALFSVDSWDSYRMFKRASKRIRTDQETYDLLVGAISDYVARVALGYLLLGLLLGTTVWLLLRLWYPREPGRLRLCIAGFGALILFFVLGYMEQAVLFPALYDSFDSVGWWADHVNPRWIEASAVTLAALILGVCARRWKAAGDPHRFGKRLGALALWVGALFLILRPPSLVSAKDNDALNVVIIGVDSLRPDHIGFFGYDRDTAPHMNALLEDSFIFESAWTPLARTYPAWTAMMSGRLPHNNGIRDNLPEPDKLVPSVPLLPQVLQEAGWTTTFATDDSRFSYMVPALGWDRILQPLPNLKNFSVSLNEPRYRAFGWLLHNPLGFTILPTAAYNQAFSKSYRPTLFARRAVDALSRTTHSGAPFFYAVHSCVLHAPGERPHPWHQMWGQNGYTGKNRFRYSRFGTGLMGDEKKGKKKRKAEKRMGEQDLRIYDSGIDMADQLVGMIVAELKQSGLWDNTIVVLISDHGEEHWAPRLPYEFHGPNHGFHAYGDGQHKVVWAIRMPDGSHKGTRVAQTVRLTDLVPTLAELIGIDFDPEIDGKSAMNLVRGETETDSREVYIETGVTEPRYWVKGHRKYPFKRLSAKYKIDEASGLVQIKPSFRPHLIGAKDRVMQLDEWKLIWHAMKKGHRYQLFNREKDPLNRKDIKAAHPEIVADLLTRLSPYLKADGITPPPLPEVNAPAE